MSDPIAPAPSRPGVLPPARPSRLDRIAAGLRHLGRQLLVPVIAIVLALIVGAVIMVLSSPLIDGELDLTIWITAYKALWDGSFGSEAGRITTLVEATPLILAGLAVGLGFKAGLFNIGAQGQFLMGGMAAAIVGGSLAGASPFVAVTAAIIAGVIAGALYGFIPGALKAYTGAHEVVTTIMLNYVAIFIIAYLVSGPLRDAAATFARTVDVGGGAAADRVR